MAKVCRSSVSTKFLICFFHFLLVWTANTWDPEIPLRSRKNARRYSFSECSLSRYKTWQCTSIPKSTTTATASATRCYYSSSCCCYHPITFSNNFWVPCPMTCQKKVWSKVHQRQPLLLASPLIIDHHEGLMSHNSTNSLKPISRISFLSTLKFGAQKNPNEHISWFLNMLQPSLERVPSRMFRKHVTKISESTQSFEHPGKYHIPLPAGSWSEVRTLNKPA